MHVEQREEQIQDSEIGASVMTKDRGEDLSGSEESDESAGSGSQAPPGAGEASDRDERAVEAQSVPEGGGAATEQPNPTYTPFFQTSFGTMDRAVLEEPEGVLRNGVALEVMKRDGRKQQLKAFKLRARITRLMKGLNDDFVFPELVVQKVLTGLLSPRALGVFVEPQGPLRCLPCCKLDTCPRLHRLLQGRTTTSKRRSSTPSWLKQLRERSPLAPILLAFRCSRTLMHLFVRSSTLKHHLPFPEGTDVPLPK
eukprot:601094-Rhodomonas_salina.2